MMEFWIERNERQKKKKKSPWIAPLSNRRAGFRLFRDLLGRIPYDKALEKNGPGKLVGIQGSPPPSREKVCPDKKEIKQKEKGDLCG